MFRVVSGCEGVSVIDGVTGIEGIDGGVGVIECVSPGAAGSRSKVPYALSPLVVVTSSKEGESSPSTSEMERLPVAVVVPESSVTEPVATAVTSIISASDGDGDGLFCVVGGGEGVSVIDGVTGIESIDGGVGVIERVSPGAALDRRCRIRCLHWWWRHR